MTLNPSLVSSAVYCNHGRGLCSLGLHLKDGVSWGYRRGILVRKDEDSLARQ